MKVKVINGYYDADLLRIVEKDEIKDFDEAKAKRLIALRLVVEAKEEVTTGEIDENGNFIVDGEVIGQVDGDNILITDPGVIEETLKEMAEEEKKAEEETEAEAETEKATARKKK